MQTVNSDKANSGLLKRTWSEWFSSLPVFLLLVLTLIIGTGEYIHGQLLTVGEKLYGDPAAGIQYSYLRADPTAPSCERHPNIDAQVQQQMAGGGAAASDDPFGDLFGPKDPEQIRQSLLAAQADCEQKFQFYEKTKQYIDSNAGVKVFRSIETSFFFVFHFGTENRALILVLMVMIAAITATLNVHHIGLRPPTTKLDFKVHDIAMTIGNAFLVLSCVMYINSLNHSGVETEAKLMYINYLWLICFAALTAISLWRVFKPVQPKEAGKGKLSQALLSVPLYAYMSIVSGFFFTFFMDYGVGQAIYLGQMAEYSNIFLNISLFIWVGMLLTQTRVMDLFLNILRPWNFSPETLTWLILLGASIPTAYTGASGIFVVAAGAMIYKEVWNSGARRQYALAASAISGSLGVVVRPCLLIVVIVALNREVTSDQLFGYGMYVFWLTAFLMLGFSLLIADDKSRFFKIASPGVAIKGMFRALGPVAPYVVIVLGVVYFYQYALNTHLNEFTAPVILPLILLAIVFYDKIIWRDKTPVAAFAGGTQQVEEDEKPIVEFEQRSLAHEEESPYLRTHDPHGKDRRVGFEQAIRFATNETIGHIGALLMLMALSVAVGGLIERAEIVHYLPHDMGIWGALVFMMLLLAFVGMVTDPFGAVILVSATIAPVAYQYGIHPIHFWMIVLMAFEFGYVTPPIALNHQLTRMSVGDAEVLAADAEAKEKYTSFYFRYERWLLPMLILGTALVITTFAPRMFHMFGWY
jgi:TRAP-type C4-dicarboxylate transport system permease large subunit